MAWLSILHAECVTKKQLQRHASVARVAIELGKRYEVSRPGIAAIALGQAVVAGANLAHLVRAGEVTKGGWYKRIANISTAAFAIIASRGNEPATKTAGYICAATQAVTAVPHFRGVGRPTGEKIRKL